MSKQNVEIVRRVYDAAVRRDTEVVFELYDTEVELDASRLGTFSTLFRGHDGLRSLFSEWHEAWGEVEYSYDELIDAGDKVISIATRHARGRASGIDVEMPVMLVWTLRDGKVVRVVWFLDRDEALEAAGVSE